jgi:hypothetical protein
VPLTPYQKPSRTWRAPGSVGLDGEQTRQHFIHTFLAGLEGIDFS